MASPVIQQSHTSLVPILYLIFTGPIMEITASLSFTFKTVSKIKNREYGKISFGFRLYSEAYGLIPDITRSSFLLSTSNTKLKLPVHPNVPTNTSPWFSSDFPSNESWKKGEQNILARAPNLVINRFFTKFQRLFLHMRLTSPVSREFSQEIVVTIQVQHGRRVLMKLHRFLFLVADFSESLLSNFLSDKPHNEVLQLQDIYHPA